MAWKYNSHAELVADGYVWRGEGVCDQCVAGILWYTNVDRKRVPIDPGTYKLHFITCAARKKAREDRAKVIPFGARKRKRAQPGFDFDSGGAA